MYAFNAATAPAVLPARLAAAAGLKTLGLLGTALRKPAWPSVARRAGEAGGSGSGVRGGRRAGEAGGGGRPLSAPARADSIPVRTAGGAPAGEAALAALAAEAVPLAGEATQMEAVEPVEAVEAAATALRRSAYRSVLSADSLVQFAGATCAIITVVDASARNESRSTCEMMMEAIK